MRYIFIMDCIERAPPRKMKTKRMAPNRMDCYRMVTRGGSGVMNVSKKNSVVVVGMKRRMATKGVV